jgi:hypothetical protein
MTKRGSSNRVIDYILSPKWDVLSYRLIVICFCASTISRGAQTVIGFMETDKVSQKVEIKKQQLTQSASEEKAAITKELINLREQLELLKNQKVANLTFLALTIALLIHFFKRYDHFCSVLQESEQTQALEKAKQIEQTQNIED